MANHVAARTLQRTWIGVRIKELRDANRLTQYALGRLIGLTEQGAQSAINHWETAYSSPRATAVPALCNALRITPTQFFEGFPP